MLTEDGFLHPLVQLSKPASLLASIGFFWDGERKEMVVMSPKGLHFHRVTSFIHAISVGSMLLQTVVRREPDFSRVLISSFGLIVLCFTTITVWVYHKHLRRVVSLINDLIASSKEFRDPGPRSMDTMEKFINFLAPLFHWSAMSVPFAFVGGVVYTMPCMGSSFGYIFLEECSSSSGGGETGGPGTAWLVFIGANLVLWCYSIQCAVFVVIGVEMLGAMSIRSFLKYYEQIMLGIPAKGYTSPKHLHESALIYRRMQLLTDNLNAIHATHILVPLLFTVSSHQVFSTYGVIRFKGQLNFVSYALFGILASQGVLVIMGMFTALANIHSTSVQVKENLVKAHRSHKWLRRFHAGCSLIKIRFGALNYVDSFTPLSFESFAIAQTANMLLAD